MRLGSELAELWWSCLLQSFPKAYGFHAEDIEIGVGSGEDFHVAMALLPRSFSFIRVKRQK